MTSTMIITACLIVCFFGLMIGIGVKSRKHATDINGFVLGSRSVGPWLSAFAFGTSYFSAVIFVGYAGQFGWNFGLASTWIGLGNAFVGSLLAWSILGRRTRIMTQHLSSNTMPDFFGARFGSKGLKVAASIITFLFLIPYTASLYNGLSRLFSMAFNGIDYSVCIQLHHLIFGSLNNSRIFLKQLAFFADCPDCPDNMTMVFRRMCLLGQGAQCIGVKIERLFHTGNRCNIAE